MGAARVPKTRSGQYIEPSCSTGRFSPSLTPRIEALKWKTRARTCSQRVLRRHPNLRMRFAASNVIDYSSEPVSDSIINETDEEKRFQELEEFLKNNLITTTASEMDMFGFRERVVHRAKYIGDRDYGRILDVAFGTNIESDIVRIKDSYGRA